MTSATKLVGKLNSLLIYELSAIETYQHAFQKIKNETVKAQLQPLLAGHQARLDRLRAAVAQAGGAPAQTSGLWGAFSRAVEAGAAIFGDKAAVAALEEGEVAGLADYKHDLEDLDPTSHKLVMGELLPAQQDSYETIRKIHDAMK